MVIWVLVAAPVLGLLVLALAARPVLVRLARLRRAALVLRRRQSELDELLAAAATLGERTVELRSQAERAQAGLAEVAAARARD